jgi:parallel beta-helix repeat protein
MQNNFWMKSLLVAIILLLVGTNVVPGFHVNLSDNPQLMNRGRLYVGGSGPGNYTTIQDAINHASDGDTVYVYKGIYNENVVVNKSITLEGENQNNTIIDGQKAGTVISVHNTSVCVKGFTIQNSGWKFLSLRAGIKITARNTTILNNIISSNQIGIYLSSSNNKVIENKITKNIFCVNLYSSSNNTLDSNIIRFGVQGINLMDSDDNNIQNNTIQILAIGCIYLSDSYRNIVQHNNFFNYYPASGNFESSVTLKSQLDDGMKDLKLLTWTNIWFNNYWNRPRLLPYPINCDLRVDAVIGKAYLEKHIFLWDLYPAQQPFKIL